MLGAIAGDIAGSIYEGNNIKTKDFELLSEKGMIRCLDHKCFWKSCHN